MEKKKNLGAAPVGVQGEQRKRKKMPSPGWGAGRVRVNGERRGERGEKREKCGEKSLELGGKRKMGKSSNHTPTTKNMRFWNFTFFFLILV